MKFGQSCVYFKIQEVYVLFVRTTVFISSPFRYYSSIIISIVCSFINSLPEFFNYGVEIL